MAITEFLLFVLTATIGGMFLCGVEDHNMSDSAYQPLDLKKVIFLDKVG